ncbi:hypothetical protein EAS64_25030 [Trebonia kvetii]|uniref:DUF6545 domain-containing protein n=1 Tax=Trebonia kvetii TaxID=2480626 RepID=A0A6P2BTT6_9ACTN|nr:MAB_1171c family putative transporter [Trebonia kvetii]TVZ02107.1 hypothetical protein EAS64_25030 [Trebonia kvetii]
MAVVYWVAAATAAFSAAWAIPGAVRDRSLTLTGLALSMTAFSACLGMAAAFPDVLQAGTSGPAVWAAAGLGAAGTWTLSATLATAGGGIRHFADIIMVPVLGGACIALLLVRVKLAASPGAHGAAQSGPAVITAQLALVTFYAPGLFRIAALARRHAGSARERRARVSMCLVWGSAGAELVLTLARSALIVACSAGPGPGRPVISVIAFLQGCAVIPGIGVMAVGPAMMHVASQCRLWIAYWRLRPLWGAMLQAVPQVELPAARGSGFGIRWRLLRRVIEIRDAELALRPYWRGDVAVKASAAARSAALSADQEAAEVEAAVVMDAAEACRQGKLPSHAPVSEGPWLGAGDDLNSEVVRLVRVSRVIRRRITRNLR